MSLVIEVKGCWNQELQTGLKGQLVDRYLRGNPRASGLYLVGWFLCDRWTASDYKRANCPAWTLDEARTFFAGQANAEKAEDRIGAFVLDGRMR